MSTTTSISTVIANETIAGGQTLSYGLAGFNPQSFYAPAVTSAATVGNVLTVTSGWRTGTDWSGPTFAVTNNSPSATTFSLLAMEVVSDGAAAAALRAMAMK
jgi:hypothetical protein